MGHTQSPPHSVLFLCVCVFATQKNCGLGRMRICRPAAERNSISLAVDQCGGPTATPLPVFGEEEPTALKYYAPRLLPAHHAWCPPVGRPLEEGLAISRLERFPLNDTQDFREVSASTSTSTATALLSGFRLPRLSLQHAHMRALGVLSLSLYGVFGTRTHFRVSQC